MNYKSKQVRSKPWLAHRAFSRVGLVPLLSGFALFSGCTGKSTSIQQLVNKKAQISTTKQDANAGVEALSAEEKARLESKGYADEKLEAHGAPVRLLQSPQYQISTGVRRISNVEYVETVEKIFGMEVPPLFLTTEQTLSGHAGISAATKTGLSDIQVYTNLAEMIVKASEGSLVAQLNCDAASITSECVKEYLEKTLPLAFRGSVSAELVTRYVALYSQANDSRPSARRFTSVIEAILISPFFLYRFENAVPDTGAEVEGLASLKPAELAGRLSFLLTSLPPDAELLAAAADGSLLQPEVRVAQAKRLLQFEQAKASFREFVTDWLDIRKSKVSIKDDAVLEGLNENFAQDAKASYEMFLNKAFELESGHASYLFSSADSFLNSTLAPVYGQEVASLALTPVKVNAAERRGLLGFPHVIAAHSKESGVSPFIMGKFIRTKLMCETVGAPPSELPMTPVELDPEVTFRQKLEAITQGPACAACHNRISPPGFAFLSFDPVGRFNMQDGLGRAFDTSGKLVATKKGEHEFEFANAAELSAGLASHPQVLKCFSRRLFRRAFARFEAKEDEKLLSSLEALSVSSAGSYKEVLLKLIESEDFTKNRVSVAASKPESQ